jgi:sugar lactone lactonase YvrE
MERKSATTGFSRSNLARGLCRALLLGVGGTFLAVMLAVISVACASDKDFPPGGAVTPPGNPQIQLWVADTQNNRMLMYPLPATNGEAASIVIGQPDFGRTACNTGVLSLVTLCGPTGAALDANGNLWVADTGNNRVLEFTFPFRNGQPAALVIGQPGFATSGACTPGPMSICGPRKLAFDQRGNLWVSDERGNRVLEFVPPFFIGMVATLVLGQRDFTTSACADSPPSAIGMCSPSGLAFDSRGDLFVSDTQNSRVLMFKPPFSIGMPATLAIGQLNLLSNNRLVTSQFSLSRPSGISVDGSNNLYVADSDNSRIMIFPSPSNASGENASMVLGNTNFATINPNQCGPAIDGGTICHPFDVKVDGSGNVLVADQNNRTLIFATPITTGKFASAVLGQPSLTVKVPPTGIATSQNDAEGIAISGTVIRP